MLYHYRRYWAFVVAILLATPLVVGLVAPAGRSLSVNEARMLAPTPALPHTFAQWLSVPRQVDAYLRDHFGLRQLFLRGYGMIMNRALKNAGNPLVLSGTDGWMFYRGDGMIQQSAGIVRRDAQVASMADFLATMRTLLAARGIRMLAASPPNSATIYGDHLPLWAKNRGQRTEYDVLMEDLAARGVPAVDLRPVLVAAEPQGQLYYKHDTHWTPRGAVAGFNAIVRADAHPDWTFDPDTVLGAPGAIAGGDLARMLGVEAEVSERGQAMALPAGHRELFGTGTLGPYRVTGDQHGPTIMIIGNSFTADLFAPLLLQRTATVVWLHHQMCRFDWKWIDEFRPDEVWWMPTERYMSCRHGDRPLGFPDTSAAR